MSGALPTVSKILKGMFFSKQPFSILLVQQFRRASWKRGYAIRAFWQWVLTDTLEGPRVLMGQITGGLSLQPVPLPQARPSSCL